MQGQHTALPLGRPDAAHVVPRLACFVSHWATPRPRPLIIVLFVMSIVFILICFMSCLILPPLIVYPKHYVYLFVLFFVPEWLGVIFMAHEYVQDVRDDV